MVSEHIANRVQASRSRAGELSAPFSRDPSSRERPLSGALLGSDEVARLADSSEPLFRTDLDRGDVSAPLQRADTGTELPSRRKEANFVVMRPQDLGVAARSGRDAAMAAVKAARDVLVADYMAHPHRASFTRTWETVDQIPGWLTKASGAALFHIVQRQRPQTIVEIGSYLGRSTVLLALALRDARPDGRLVAIDPHTGDRQHLEALSTSTLPSYDLFRSHLRAAGVEDTVEVVVDESVSASRNFEGGVDLLYVDGWHSYDAVLADGAAWLPKLRPQGVVVFDDYTKYPEVARAIHDLANTGEMHFWGAMFDQAIGGKERRLPPEIARVTRLQRSPARVLYRRARPDLWPTK